MMVIDDALDFLIFFCCRKRLLFLTLSHGEDIITIITRVIISTWSVTTTYILFEKKRKYISFWRNRIWSFFFFCPTTYILFESMQAHSHSHLFDSDINHLLRIPLNFLFKVSKLELTKDLVFHLDLSRLNKVHTLEYTYMVHHRIKNCKIRWFFGMSNESSELLLTNFFNPSANPSWVYTQALVEPSWY